MERRDNNQGTERSLKWAIEHCVKSQSNTRFPKPSEIYEKGDVKSVFAARQREREARTEFCPKGRTWVSSSRRTNNHSRQDCIHPDYQANDLCAKWRGHSIWDKWGSPGSPASCIVLTRVSAVNPTQGQGRIWEAPWGSFVRSLWGSRMSYCDPIRKADKPAGFFFLRVFQEGFPPRSMSIAVFMLQISF